MIDLFLSCFTPGQERALHRDIDLIVAMTGLKDCPLARSSVAENIQTLSCTVVHVVAARVTHWLFLSSIPDNHLAPIYNMELLISLR